MSAINSYSGVENLVVAKLKQFLSYAHEYIIVFTNWNPVLYVECTDRIKQILCFAVQNKPSVSCRGFTMIKNRISDHCSLIIDLRGNGGGLTNEAESIANTLLPKGSVIYSTKDRSGKTEVIKTTKEGNTEIPVVILVDGNSASASELLSASIKENGRGVLVGTQTFGKALVQTMFNFYDNSALKVTIQQYFTPNGNDINLNGIEPDHIVELKTAADEQLDFAKTILSQQ